MMSVRKLSISLTPELADALDALAEDRDEDRSRLVEILLREHPLVSDRIRSRRARDRPGDERLGLKEAVLVGRAAGRRWERRTSEGEMELREPGD
jgi:predicted transcriptional regulator